MDDRTIKSLAEASQAIGLFQGLVQSLPSPQLLVRPFVRREAELSSRIEGTYANQEELVLFETRSSDRRGQTRRPRSMELRLRFRVRIQAI